MTGEAKPTAGPGSSQLMNQGLRIMQIVSKSLFRKAGLCALLLASQLAFAVAIEPLEYTPQHQKTTTEVVSQLVQKHYREQALDDELSARSEEHTSELQSRGHLVCRLLLEKKN